jgi:hypothetical protein
MVSNRKKGDKIVKGILFKPWKAKAIGESDTDRLWQTRRVMKLKLGIPSLTISDEQFKKNLQIMDVKGHYQVGEVVYIKEAYRVLDIDLRDIEKPLQRVKVEYKLDGETRWVMKPKDKPITIPDKWHSPMMMPEWVARTFIQIAGVRAERLRLPLSPEDLALEGGEEALVILKNCDGLWLWIYEFVRKEKSL